MYIIIIEITPTNVKKSAKQSLKMRESITVPVDETMVSAAMKSELQSSMPPPAKEKRNLNDVLVAVMYAQWAVMALLVCIVFIRLVYSSDNLWLFFVLFTLILLFFFGPSFIAVDQLMRLRQGRSRDAEKVVEAPAAAKASTAAAATTKKEQPLPSEAASETTASPTPELSIRVKVDPGVASVSAPPAQQSDPGAHPTTTIKEEMVEAMAAQVI